MTPETADGTSRAARRGRLLVLALVGMGTFGCDRITKGVAGACLAGAAPRSYLGGAVRLLYVENPGAFLSLGAGLPAWARAGLFTFGAGLGLAGIAFLILRHSWDGPVLLGLSLIWAGGASNLLDRLLRGRVVDFLEVGVTSWRTGIFNVADVAITAGALLAGWGLGEFRRARGPGPRRTEVGR